MSKFFRLLAAAPIAFVMTSAPMAEAADPTQPTPAVYKQCKRDHYHWGKAQTANSKVAAQQLTIVDWTKFTEFEYGKQWIDFRIAKNPSVKCEKAGIGKWTCVASAIPCRVAAGPVTATLRAKPRRNTDAATRFLDRIFR